MKFARLHKMVRSPGLRSDGYEFFGSMRDAEKSRTKYNRNHKGESPTPEIDTIEIECTRDGIIAGLNKYAGHPDNG